MTASRNVLALDCTFGGHGVAVFRCGSLQEHEHHPDVHASEGIIDTLDRLLALCEMQLPDFDAIAFGAGPGLFSGIRSACANSQGLAYANNLPVIPVPSSLALAHSIGADRALIAYKAHRGHCYLSAYERTGCKLRETLAPGLYRLDDLPGLEGDWRLCNKNIPDGFEEAMAKRIAGKLLAGADPGDALAPAVGELALQKLADGELVKPEDAHPLYVREKVALTAAERQAGMEL